MKDIKFRYWDPFNQMMFCSEVTHLADFFRDYELALYGNNNPVLMQFTGLQDTNGRDIYEGDILEIEYGLSDYYYVVEWVFAGFQLVTYKKPGSTIRGISDGLNQGYFEESDETKVIGNIYETAETEEN